MEVLWLVQGLNRSLLENLGVNIAQVNSALAGVSQTQ